MPERAMTLAMVFAALVLVLLGRLFQLQLVQGERLEQAVEDSRAVVELLTPKRGRILDRHGTAIVDNRAMYQISVVLSDLEPPRRVRRVAPILVLDESAFDRLLADLGMRLTMPQEQLRALLLRELDSHPAVGLRRSAEIRDTALTLLALPGTALTPDEQESAAELATSDLLCEDPREALAREVRAKWGENAAAFTEEEVDAAAAMLGPGTGIAGSRVATVLRSFAPLITARLGNAPDSPRLTWRLITAERRRQAAIALARFRFEDASDVESRLAQAFGSARRPPAASGFYFAASADALEIATLLPKTAALHRVPLEGVPPARERIVLIQGDPSGVQDGLFSQVCDRLAASLGAPGPWVGGLIERHAARMRPITVERQYRRRVLVFDPEKLARLCVGLSTRLTALGVPTSVLDVEHHLADARRIADKEWEGEGHDDPLPLFPDVPHRAALALAETGASAPSELLKRFDGLTPELPGIRVTVNAGRDHPFGDSLVHLLGTLGLVEHELDYDNAVERGLDPAGWIGQSGIEKHYDQVLRGKIGRRVTLRSPEGAEELKQLGRPAVDGEDLTTELDMEVQVACEKSLDHWYELAEQLATAGDKMNTARAIGRGRAGMVVIDCQTGGILALASSPRYQPQNLSKHWEQLVKDPSEPLHDHAAEAAQPPGSALKILTALACLEHGVVSPGEMITTKGYMAMFHGKPVLRSHAPAGTYDLAEAIQISDNCYFATIGQRLGGEKLSAYFQRFGMGTRMGLDVPEEKPGILPTPGDRGRKWSNPGDTWHMAIGQFSTASPLQVACIAATVANGGHVVRPFVVKPHGAPVVVDLQVRADWMEDVRNGMEKVTEPGGTAQYLNLSGSSAGIQVAAKTGTSEWGNANNAIFPDHAWLIGYAPADEPKIAFAVFIHSGTSGGRACSGVAKQVLETYFGKYGRAGHARVVEP